MVIHIFYVFVTNNMFISCTIFETYRPVFKRQELLLRQFILKFLFDKYCNRLILDVIM